MNRKGRVSMDKHIQVLHMHQQGFSQGAISSALKMCPKTVKKCLQQKLRSETVALSPASDGMQLENKTENLPPGFPDWLQQLDWKTLQQEVLKGVPFKVLFDECPQLPVKYWSFWKAVSKLAELRREPVTTMRLKHNPGEKTFVDYTDGIDIYNIETGEVVSTELFVGTLPFSSKVFAEFTFDQKLPTFIQSHEKMWQFFGGVTRYTVTDNLKSSVTRADLYDPDKNKTFTAYANYAGFAVLPARPNRPKDKANVECHAGLLQRTFYQTVRNRTFTSITELNETLIQFLKHLNNQVMKDHGVSRNERFELEKSTLQPVPGELFEIPEVKEATVHPDCHIQFGRSFYSVPHVYVGQKVRVIGTFSKVCIYNLRTLEKIASHSRARKNGERKTEELHWPSQKKEHCDFNIERAKSETEKIGKNTLNLIVFLFDLPHPLQYLRRVQGWVRLVSHGRVSREAMEYASGMALQHNRYASKYVSECANFFESGGTLRSVPSAAPKRDARFNFVQN